MSGRTISGIISIISGKFGRLLLGILITPILVRILGSEKYGDYALLLAIFSIITTLTHAGISAGIRKYIVEDRKEAEWKNQVYAFYTRFGMTLAVLFALGLIIFGYYGPAEALFGSSFPLYLSLLAVMLISDQFFYVNRYTLIGLDATHISESAKMIKKILYGFFAIILAYIGYDVAGVLAGTTFATIISGIITIWFLKNRISIRKVFSASSVSFPRRELLSFNIQNTIFILFTVSLYNIDILLLQPIIGSQETGIYKAALVIAEFVWLVPMAIQIIFIGSASKQWSKNNIGEITLMASRATRFTLSISILLIVGLTALSADFITIYFGAEFTDAALPLLILMPGVLGFAVARPIFAIGQGKGALRILIAATGSAALINLVMNIILIPQYGIIGAAIATSVGYGSMLFFHVIAAQKIGFNPLVDLRFPQILITGITTGIFVFVAASFIESGIYSLIIVPPIGFIIYSVMSIKTKVITSHEIQLLADQLPDQLSTLIIQTNKWLQ